MSITAGSAIGQQIGSIFDFLINAVNGLLLMSVIVALIGIVNTMSLSILERRRELGLLRVVGMLDRRVRRMVRHRIRDHPLSARSPACPSASPSATA